MTDTYDMDTFGKPIATTGSTPNPYRYGAAWGYITDPNGFLQLGARYLWPEVGRFVQQDPARPGNSQYTYAKNRPLWYTDPLGLWELGGEAYLLIGGGAYLGKNCDGTWYVKFKAGVGVGGGIGFDPCGESPSPNSGRRPSSGSFFGLSGSASGQIGTFIKGRTSSMGVISDASGKLSDYGGPDWDWSPPGNMLGAGYPPTFIGLGLSDTAEGGFFF